MHVIEDHVLSQLSSVENAQGVLSLVRISEAPLSGIVSGQRPLIVALDGIQDPGNAGAILRSAEAFGATGAVFIKGTVNPWNPKLLRASAGSIFRIPFCLAEWSGFQSAAAQHGIAVFAASPHAAGTIADAPLGNAAAILIGSEGAGIPGGHLAAATAIRIPTQTVESLNAATAAAILLYEANRQRS